MSPFDGPEPAAAPPQLPRFAGNTSAGEWGGGAAKGAANSTLSERTARGIGDYLAGRRRGIRASLLFVGPAFLVSTAYMDPGNFAVNIEAGARYGYSLLWVVVLASLAAMLFQALAAKLGLATGQNLAELCRRRYPRPLVWAMWLGSEVAAMATELAELVGGAMGLALLFKIPLPTGVVVISAATYAILALDRRGFRPIEAVLAGFVAIVGGICVAQLWLAPIHWPAAAAGALVPRLPDSTALALAAGIVGATVMPHALYLHSGLLQQRFNPRNRREARLLIRFSNREVVLALASAGVVNLALVLLAAAVGPGRSAATIAGTFSVLAPLFGQAAAVMFAVALIASGISSSVVGTMAGQIVMQDFVGFRIPVWLRRLATTVPALAVVAIGTAPGTALVLSQIVLSLALPIPLIPLVLLTRDRDVMGPLVNRHLVDIAAVGAAALILLLDFALVVHGALR